VTFVDEFRDRFGVESICRVLTAHGVKIAPSGYYAHKRRVPSARRLRDAELADLIAEAHADPDRGRGCYGYRKMWHQLRRDGVVVARCTVARLMREAGLHGVVRGRRFVTTRPDPAAVRPPDLVNRDFSAARPNQLWLVDFTYVPTWTGMKFTAFVHDAYSRRIVGWRTAASMPTELPLDALEMALWTREGAGHDISGVIHHSDAGAQYTSIRYSTRLSAAGAVASIGSVGDSYDNAEAESLIGLYKAECVRREGPWRGVDDLELATLNWVHWYNENRLHTALDYQTPTEHENAYYSRIKTAQQPLSGELALH
jgi:putative transposase